MEKYLLLSALDYLLLIDNIFFVAVLLQCAQNSFFDATLSETRQNTFIRTSACCCQLPLSK